MSGRKWPQPALIVALVALALALIGVDRSSRGSATSAAPPGPGHWFVRGCPSGTHLVNGTCFDRRTRGPLSGVKAAADRCAAAGGFLPTPLELAAARAVLDLGEGRFTDSYFFSARAGRLRALTVVVDDRGQHAVPALPPAGDPKDGFGVLCAYEPETR